MSRPRRRSDGTWEYPQWSIHVDGPWAKDVREFGAPLRAYIWTPWRHVIVSLWPGNGSQVYDWKSRTYTDRYSWFVTLPRP
jgi:hypothetical protein